MRRLGPLAPFGRVRRPPPFTPFGPGERAAARYGVSKAVPAPFRSRLALLAALLALAAPTAAEQGAATGAASAPGAPAVASAAAFASAAASVAGSEATASAASIAAPAVSATAASLRAEAGWPVAEVEQPRPFGHFVGDVLTQRVLLQSRGQRVRLDALPAAAQLGVWFERRAGSVERDAAGRDWLVLHYQLRNAPRAAQSLMLPALVLPAKGTGLRTGLQVPAWPIDVAPLAARAAADDITPQSLRADRPAPGIAMAPIERRAQAGLAALGGVLGAWLLWALWRRRRDAARLPFAAAWRELRALDDHSPQAWQALHRAFDRTSGRVTRGTTWPGLLQAAPHLAPLQPQIDRFFAQSGQLFFGAGLPADALSPRQLCAALRRLETRHAQ